MKKKIVVLGGGTGLPTLLKGLKYINDIDITAIVTVADSGGSTGILSNHFGIPAVGDLRRVIAALSRNREELEESMEYRISGTDSALDGHTVGNFLIASQIMMKGDFAKGISATTKMLNIEGEILPVSNEFNHLCAELEDGTKIQGEDNIGHSKGKIKKVYYENGNASELAVKAINKADLIIFGIGSLYTSLIANLIYKDINNALKASSADILYFANVFTQHGETDDMTLSDHIKAIEEHTYKGVVSKVITADVSKIDKDVISSYEDEDQFLLKRDTKSNNVDLVSVSLNPKTNKQDIKHDQEKLRIFFEKLLLKLA